MARLRLITRVVTSAAGAAVVSEPVRVNGRQVGGHVYAPGANLVDIEYSEDLQDWASATSRVDGSTALEQLENQRFELFERPKWVRFEVRIDAGGPRNFQVTFAVRESTD